MLELGLLFNKFSLFILDRARDIIFLEFTFFCLINSNDYNILLPTTFTVLVGWFFMLLFMVLKSHVKLFRKKLLTLNRL